MKDEYKEMVCRVRFIDGVPAETYLSDIEIVRCKDCKHYTGYECQRSKVSNIRVITNEDDYCSRAERRKDDRRQNNTV